MQEEGQGRLTFARPPIIELVLGVQFEPLRDFRMRHVGELYRLFQSQFPGYEEHPPVEPVTETFTPRQEGPFRIEWATTPPLPRVWLLEPGGNEVIQFQRDRFLHNWRKVESADLYPSYVSCRELFETSLRKFLSFIEENACGKWVPNQCELTYINHILPVGAWSRHAQIGGAIRPWSDQAEPVPENISLALQYVIPDEHKQPVGRVHVAVRPKWRLPEQSPLLELSLTSRGKPGAPSIRGVMEFLDLAHVWGQRVFLSITTEAIQKEWGMTWQQA